MRRPLLALALAILACLAFAHLARAQGQINTPGQPVMAAFVHRVTSTPTIQAAQYVSGNCLGGFNQITISNYNGQTGYIVGARVVSLTGQGPSIWVSYFSSQPTASTCTDRSTFSVATADISKLIDLPQAMTVTSPTGYTPSFGKINYIPPQPFISGGSVTAISTTIWYALVSGSTWIPGSTADVQLTTSIMLNQ